MPPYLWPDPDLPPRSRQADTQNDADQHRKQDQDADNSKVYLNDHLPDSQPTGCIFCILQNMQPLCKSILHNRSRATSRAKLGLVKGLPIGPVRAGPFGIGTRAVSDRIMHAYAWHAVIFCLGSCAPSGGGKRPFLGSNGSADHALAITARRSTSLTAVRSSYAGIAWIREPSMRLASHLVRQPLRSRSNWWPGLRCGFSAVPENGPTR
jgi:hypothetical protein